MTEELKLYIGELNKQDFRPFALHFAKSLLTLSSDKTYYANQEDMKYADKLHNTLTYSNLLPPLFL